jgi:hypothetical protein
VVSEHDIYVLHFFLLHALNELGPTYVKHHVVAQLPVKIA